MTYPYESDGIPPARAKRKADVIADLQSQLADAAQRERELRAALVEARKEVMAEFRYDGSRQDKRRNESIAGIDAVLGEPK